MDGNRERDNTFVALHNGELYGQSQDYEKTRTSYSDSPAGRHLLYAVAVEEAKIWVWLGGNECISTPRHQCMSGLASEIITLSSLTH